MTYQNNKPLYLSHAGPKLLDMPLLNKSSAFSERERIEFNLDGLLPPRYETIEQQRERAYLQYQDCSTAMSKHIFLRDIQDKNETLFYRLISEHLEEMMPIIYTPTVGEACEKFSDIYRSARGLFIAHHQQDRIDAILHNATKRNIKVIVVTDGERILGLGDQGVGGMGIPIGKLSLYTVCGGVSPANTLPITLDVGTNNAALLEDPMYMGCRHPRISQSEYDKFLDKFMQAVSRRWPNALIQFEDFAQHNATPLLSRYRDKYCCFNDDIQGTAAVAVATMLAACKAKQVSPSSQRLVIAGGGSAGCGIAEHWVRCAVAEGVSEKEARQNVFVVDRDGLLTTKSKALLPFQQRFAHDTSLFPEWDKLTQSSLLDVIHNIKPTMLLGVSGCNGLFSEAVIGAMAANVYKPIIMPLSNPSRCVEALPEDILRYTNGEAIVATGSPFEDVEINGNSFPISQCNNSYIFPGIGLAVVSCGAKKVTDNMLMAASKALAAESPLAVNGVGALLPPLSSIKQLSLKIAFEVAKQAVIDGVALPRTDEEINLSIQKTQWLPDYRDYQRVAN
ncbi:malate dehydrogenase (oxaloacetate-decarboxylating) [Alteromonas sp. I10]|uniref:NAD-dependent malic enzyme n=1 Tax=Alteromonas TaxID=226 RepID=UPI000D75AA2A|nr:MULTISPECIES: NAD-dependent malic enzyme [Alteromonas]PXW74693.1 malate dehydrogenase (oxaloacetate-decarboxylating) [Alteromonas sp. I10]